MSKIFCIERIKWRNMTTLEKVEHLSDEKRFSPIPEPNIETEFDKEFKEIEVSE